MFSENTSDMAKHNVEQIRERTKTNNIKMAVERCKVFLSRWQSCQMQWSSKADNALPRLSQGPDYSGASSSGSAPAGSAGISHFHCCLAGLRSHLSQTNLSSLRVVKRNVNLKTHLHLGKLLFWYSCRLYTFTTMFLQQIHMLLIIDL